MRHECLQRFAITTFPIIDFQHLQLSHLLARKSIKPLHIRSPSAGLTLHQSCPAQLRPLCVIPRASAHVAHQFLLLARPCPHDQHLSEYTSIDIMSPSPSLHKPKSRMLNLQSNPIRKSTFPRLEIFLRRSGFLELACLATP